MADCNYVALGKNLVTVINDHTWSQVIRAERHYHPEYEKRDLSVLKVVVVPIKLTPTRSVRGGIREDCTYAIGQWKAVKPRLSEMDYDCDVLINLLDEFLQYLAENPVHDANTRDRLPLLEMEGSGIVAPAPEFLHAYHVYTGALILTYPVIVV